MTSDTGRARLTVVSAVAVVIAGCAGWTLTSASALSQSVAPFTITLPTGDGFTSIGRHLVALSPDGTRLVYVANNRLYQRSLDQSNAAPIPGIEGTGPASPRSPFFSPDGQWVGFWQDGQIKKVSFLGGTPLVVCAASNPSGVSWTSGNRILYGQGGFGIWHVSADGGTPEQLVKIDGGQSAHGPHLLSGGRAVLFTLARNGDWDDAQVVIETVGTGLRRVVLERGTDARFLPTGHLVYALERTLLAVPFDATSLAVTGRAVPLVSEIAQAPTGAAHFAISTGGALVYIPSDAVGGGVVRTLVWVDRQGREEPISAPARMYFDPRLSPDGMRVALEIDNDIWILDLVRETLTPLTSGTGIDAVPIWMPDGHAVVFSSGRSGRTTVDPRHLFRQAADGTGPAEQLTQGPVRQVPYAVTPNGSALLFREHSTDPRGDAGDLMSLSLVGERRLQPLIQTRFREMNAELSPDGGWLAYQSNESGRDEIYVRPFPDVAAGRWQVSTIGGMRPLWARNGQELFYESMGALVRVPVTIGAIFEAGTPSKLFEGPYFYGVLERMYDVSPDSRRFLMIKASEADQTTVSARIIVVPRWIEELKRLVPVN